MAMQAIVTDRGNGLPDVGDYVPGDDGNLYRIESIRGRIETGRHTGEGNWMRVNVAMVDWDSCEESEEFPAMVSVDDDEAP